MKKVLFILFALISIATQAQVANGTETKQNAFRSLSPQTVTSSNYSAVMGNDGTIARSLSNNLSIPQVPLNYTVLSPTLGAHLTGIDNKLGTIVATTAGVTTRVWSTADPTTITAGTFYLTNATGKGTAASAIQSVVNDDNQKKYFTQDLIGQPFATATTFPPGVYAGNLSASTSPNSAQQRYTVELYRCNNAGTPIASGVAGAPIGSLGVTVIIILDSGLLTLADGSVTNVPVSGSLGGTGFSLAVGERIRYHVSAEKVGTAGANITQSIYYGTSYNSFIDVPVTFNTSGITNASTVTGATATDALNNLKTVQDTKLNKTYVSNYDVADSNITITSSTFDAFGILCQSLTNKIFMIYREGTGHLSVDGKIAMRTSTNGGKTFSSISYIAQEPGIDLRNIAGGVTPSGRIIVFYLRYNGSTSLNQGTIYSDDDGVTWSAFAPQSNLGVPSFSPYGNMITIANGRIALPWYGVVGGTGNTYLKFSDDNGSTWGGDVLVSGSTNQRNEASYAYLDGGVIVCVVRQENTGSKLRQLISLDNGQTWTDQGDIPYPKGTNIAPWLNTYTESNGEKYVALFFTSKDASPVRTTVGLVASKASILSGTSGWLTESEKIIIANPVSSDYGYTSVINPRGGKKMLGMYYIAESNSPTTTANYSFFNYTPSVVSISSDGKVLGTPKKVNFSGEAYRNHFSGYTGVSQFQNLNLQEVNTSGAEESTMSFNTYFDSTNNNKYMFNGGASWLYFGKSFFQIVTAQTGTAGNNLSGLLAALKIDYSNGGVMMASLSGPGVSLIQTDTAGNISRSTASARPYTVYTATISQSGTSDPVATVLENNIPGAIPITLTRSGVGDYFINKTDAFTLNKTFFSATADGNYTIHGGFINDDQIRFFTRSSGTLSDGLMTRASIEIRVYN